MILSKGRATFKVKIQMFEKILYSSADPTKISLTLKSFIPLALSVLTWLNIDLSDSDLAMLVDGIVMAISAFGVLYGISRKVYYAILDKSA